MTPSETDEMMRLTYELNNANKRAEILRAALQRIEGRFSSSSFRDGTALGIASTALMEAARVGARQRQPSDIEERAMQLAAAALKWPPSSVHTRWAGMSEWARGRYFEDARKELGK